MCQCHSLQYKQVAHVSQFLQLVRAVCVVNVLLCLGARSHEEIDKRRPAGSQGVLDGS